MIRTIFLLLRLILLIARLLNGEDADGEELFDGFLDEGGN